MQIRNNSHVDSIHRITFSAKEGQLNRSCMYLNFIFSAIYCNDGDEVGCLSNSFQPQISSISTCKYKYNVEKAHFSGTFSNSGTFEMKSILGKADIEYLLTESYIFKGKSQTEPCHINRAIVRSIWIKHVFKVNMLFFKWLFALFLQACNWPMGITDVLQLTNQSTHYIDYKNKP